MKTNTILLASAIIIAAIVISCSQSSREEAIDRVSDAAKALKGQSDDTPAVVKAQQKREKNRQNNEWTPENQRKHPREFCQAQLDLLAKTKEQCSDVFYKSLRAENELENEIEKAKSKAQTLRGNLGKAVSTYREAIRDETWPVSFNGLRLGKEELQRRIREEEQRYTQTTNGIPTLLTLLKSATDRKNGAQAELRKIDQLRLQVESTLRTIELQKLVEADDALVGSLDSIRISITSLVQYGDAMSDSDSSGSHSDPSDEKAFEDILNRF